MIRLLVVALVALAVPAQAAPVCVYLPWLTPATNPPADVMRVYVAGRWVRDVRWGLWPGQQETMLQCGDSEATVTLRYVKNGVESGDAVMRGDNGVILQGPFTLGQFDTPRERAMRVVDLYCTPRCTFDVNTDGILNDADRAVLQLVIEGQLK